MAGNKKHLSVKMNFNFSDDSEDDSDSSFVSRPQPKSILQELNFESNIRNENSILHYVEVDKPILVSSYKQRRSELPSVCEDFESPITESTCLSSITADLSSNSEDKHEISDSCISSGDKVDKSVIDILDLKFQKKPTKDNTSRIKQDKENMPDYGELTQFYSESSVFLHTPERVIKHETSLNKSATYSTYQLDWEDLPETPLKDSRSSRKLKLYRGEVNLTPVQTNCGNTNRWRKINPLMHGKLSSSKAETKYLTDDFLDNSGETMNNFSQNSATENARIEFDSSIEVEGVSVQTSLVLDNGVSDGVGLEKALSNTEECVHPNSSTSEHSLSFVEVQDMSVQADMESEENGKDWRNAGASWNNEQSVSVQLLPIVSFKEEIGRVPRHSSESVTDLGQNLSSGTAQASSCQKHSPTQKNTSHLISSQRPTHSSVHCVNGLLDSLQQCNIGSQQSTCGLQDFSLQESLLSLSPPSVAVSPDATVLYTPPSFIQKPNEMAGNIKSNFQTNQSSNNMTVSTTENTSLLLDMVSAATNNLEAREDKSLLYKTAHSDFHSGLCNLSSCSEKSFSNHSCSGTQQVRVSTIFYESSVENLTVHNKSSDRDILEYSPWRASASNNNSDVSQTLDIDQNLDGENIECSSGIQGTPPIDILVSETDSGEEEIGSQSKSGALEEDQIQIGESDTENYEENACYYCYGSSPDKLEVKAGNEAKFMTNELFTEHVLKARYQPDDLKRTAEKIQAREKVEYYFEESNPDGDVASAEETKAVVTTTSKCAGTRDKVAAKRPTVDSLTNELESFTLARGQQKDNESSDDDDNFENFLSKIKDSVKPVATSEKEKLPMSEFIVADDYEDEEKSSGEIDDDDDDELFHLKTNNILEARSTSRRPVRERQTLYSHHHSDSSSSGLESDLDSDLEDFIVDKPAKKYFHTTKASVPVFDLSSDDDCLLEQDEPDRGKTQQDLGHHRKISSISSININDDLKHDKRNVPSMQVLRPENSKMAKVQTAKTEKDDEIASRTDSTTLFKTPLRIPKPVRQWERPFETPISRHTELKTPDKSTVLRTYPSTAPRPPRPSNIGLDDNAYFLKSLTADHADCNRHPDAARFTKRFKDTRIELAQRLFKIFNHAVFEDKLPTDLEIEWSTRYTKTAGTFYYKGTRTNFKTKVTLSVKICDNAERVRDTLAHELCHAAVKLVNGVNESHGKFWKSWAKRTNRMFPFMPVIARCHDYVIRTKYTYQCVNCKYRIGRHSKSLDTDTKVCGHCLGKFEVYLTSELNSSAESTRTPATPRTPRTPNKFALFVKECYSNVKKRECGLKHGDIMRILSKEFAEKTKIND